MATALEASLENIELVYKSGVIMFCGTLKDDGVALSWQTP
jgi:hypothetical protein